MNSKKSTQKCPFCASSHIHKNGKTSSNKIRYLCTECKKSFSNKRSDIKQIREFVWFEQYITEFTVRQLKIAYKKSIYAIRNIIKSNLNNPPSNLFENIDLTKIKRVAFDGKFLFGRKLNLLALFDTDTSKPIAIEFVKGENQKNIIPMFKRLKEDGLNPDCMTCDGLPAIQKSAHKVWSNIKIQRCLFHIKLQVNAWTRKPPKTHLGRHLSKLVRHICDISTEYEKEKFVRDYEKILSDYSGYISTFNKKRGIKNDLRKCISLINGAIPDMFEYLEDINIKKTTSMVEGFFKHIQKIKGFTHNGLGKESLCNFIRWKVFFMNQK